MQPASVKQRVEAMWSMHSKFGEELSPNLVYLGIIANRYALTRGTQLIRDELMLSFNNPGYDSIFDLHDADNLKECSADLALPSVLTTCGYTMCGDRICQSNALRRYQSMVAGRFGSITEGGEMKPELFFATGGGTDSGPTLAHVTVGHAVDSAIKEKMYNQNPESSFLVNIDVCTHCGHLDIGKNNSAEFVGKRYDGVGVIYGLAQESVFRDPRPACGAIVGMLSNFNLQNPVHVRLRNDLGEKNFQYLSKTDVCADDGSPCKFLIAAAIIAIQGMRNTLEALGPGGELDERGVGHMTAQVQVNNRENYETMVYCARATVCNGEITEQGLGTDATKYSAKMVTVDGEARITFLYDGTDQFPIQVRRYEMKTSSHTLVKKVINIQGSTRQLVREVERRPSVTSVASCASEDCRSEKIYKGEARKRALKPVEKVRAVLREDDTASFYSDSRRSSRSTRTEASTVPRESSHSRLEQLRDDGRDLKRRSSPRTSKKNSPATSPLDLTPPSERGNTAVVHEATYGNELQVAKPAGTGFWWACLLISAMYMAMLGISVAYVSHVKAVA